MARKPRAKVLAPDGEMRYPGTFYKGDPRCWRKGRPTTSFNTLRKMAQEIANENVGPGEDEDARVARIEALIRSWSESGNPRLQQAFVELAFGKVPEAPADDTAETNRTALASIPADIIAPDFVGLFRDIKSNRHTEYVLRGGRGSTKSSFISLIIVWLIVNNPTAHAVVVRRVANTLRDSVYAQMLWAINELGMNESFKSTVSPMEMEYLPTGQKIYFRGADDPGKLKSIKPAFGSIAVLWFEELDQFAGPETIRKIEQSVIRGGERAWIFKSFNPPRTANNWANKYVQIPKDNQVVHSSTYLTVPAEWLGQPWIDEAKHLAEVNPEAYEHEYLGVANSAGGQVFGNVELRAITDEEIAEFDRVLHGVDWGYYPDPADYVAAYYDAARLTLYIFNEVRKFKTSNKDFYAAIKEAGYTDGELLVADSAEPKSVADFRDYGATARGAEKGRESVNYSMKWLQSLKKIVIDPVRAPYAAEEFLGYEFERTKDDEIISAYPDKDNHSIDATRYATNHIWKRRGK